jgi:uncharacterized protein with GYD domain
MIRVMSFVSLTDEGVRNIATFGDVVAKVREAVTRNGGTLEQAWQTAGIYDFVAVLSFPDLKMGVLRAQHVAAIPLDQALNLISD